LSRCTGRFAARPRCDHFGGGADARRSIRSADAIGKREIAATLATRYRASWE
jgi:hypothetical protein